MIFCFKFPDALCHMGGDEFFLVIFGKHVYFYMPKGFRWEISLKFIQFVNILGS